MYEIILGMITKPHGAHYGKETQTIKTISSMKNIINSSYLKKYIFFASMFFNTLYASWTLSPTTLDNGNTRSSVQLIVNI